MIATLASILLLAPFANAAKYRFDSWTSADGMPQNSVRAITHTRDGYLWLGTFEGLVRFDGVTFTNFDNVNTPEFTSNFADALIEDRNGDLWIGFEDGGLLRRRGDRFERVSQNEGLLSEKILCLLEDQRGRIYIGTSDAGLGILENGRVAMLTIADGLPSNRVNAFAADAAGDLWIGTDNGLAKLHDGTIETFGVARGLKSLVVNAVAVGAAGEVWIGTGDGLFRLASERIDEFDLANVAKGAAWLTKLLADRDGNLWLGFRGNGIAVVKPNATSAEAVFEAPGNNWISALYRDPDNTFWAGSVHGGLHRYREERFQLLTTDDGLLDDNAKSVVEDSRGTLYLNTDKGLYSYRDGRITVLPETGPFGAMAEDAAGGIWFTANRKLVRVGVDGRRTYGVEDGLTSGKITVIAPTRGGDVWIGTTNGLNLLHDGKITAFVRKDGLANDYILEIFEDRAGVIWIGTLDGLSRFENGGFTTFTKADGLGTNHILSFHETDDALWIGTSGGGLARYRDGRFVTVDSHRGLFDNLTFVILEDSRRNLWMCGNRGVYRASLDELNAVADGRQQTLSSYSYDRDDGLLSRECNGAAPAGFRTRDGRLWFPTVSGFASIDPVESNAEPPLVNIERVSVGGRDIERAERIELRPGEGNLEIQYTGISWQRPKQIHFKYRMEGLSDEWVDVGKRRTAYFSYLPPGDYVFQVIADNGEGVWNMTGRSFSIRVWPPFYRTWWFSVLAATVVALFVYWLFRRRINKLQQQRALQQNFARQMIASQELERKRIAAELHDSLGQRLVVIRNLALILLSRKPADEIAEQVEEISGEAAGAIAEVKEISYNLRPYQLDRIGLTKAIEALVRTVRAASSIEFSAEIDHIDGYFPKDAEINFYRIVQECVANVVKHSQAKNASVAISRGDDLLEFVISDDGCGFNLAQTAERSGGFGLLGISERVELFGGRLEIKSAPNGGTTIRIRIGREGRGKQ